jgi:hypothetical protein
VRPRHVVAFVAAVVGLVVLGHVLTRRPRGREAAPAAEPRRTEAAAGRAAPEDPSMPRRQVTLYWPAADGTGLRPSTVEVFATESTADQAKQVLGKLLSGEPPQGCVAPLPPGVRLRALFVDERGTAHVSFSRDLVDSAPGGSAWELAAVHAVVNSLTSSLKEIQRVQFLVEGAEVETLAGHVELSAPIAFSTRALAP